MQVHRHVCCNCGLEFLCTNDVCDSTLTGQKPPRERYCDKCLNGGVTPIPTKDQIIANLHKEEEYCEIIIERLEQRIATLEAALKDIIRYSDHEVVSGKFITAIAKAALEGK